MLKLSGTQAVVEHEAYAYWVQAALNYRPTKEQVLEALEFFDDRSGPAVRIFVEDLIETGEAGLVVRNHRVGQTRKRLEKLGCVVTRCARDGTPIDRTAHEASQASPAPEDRPADHAADAG